MKERLLAVLGAVVLIGSAFLVRSLVVGSDDGGGGNGSGAKPTIACTPDLASVCDALAAEGAIAADPPTLDLDGADAPDAQIDGWITWDPAPEIANFDGGTEAVWAESEVLGSARNAVLATPDAIAALPKGCAASPTWTCVADPSAALATGVGDPNTAEGLARLAPLARTFTTEDDVDQLDASALGDLVDGPANGQDTAPAQSIALATRPGELQLVVGPNDLLEAQRRTEQGTRRGLRTLSPGPADRLTVVVAGRPGRKLGSLADPCASSKARDAMGPALERLGLQACEGTKDDSDLAGFLYQVRKKVG